MTIDNRPLEQRLGDLDNATSELQQVLPEGEVLTTAKDIAIEQGVYTTAQDNNPENPQSVFTGETVEVAGVGSIIRKGAEELLKQQNKVDSTLRPIVKPGVDRTTVKDFQVIPEATDERGIKVLQIQDEMPTTGKPSPKKKGAPKTTFNLNMIQDEDALGQHIEAVALEYGAKNYEKISYKEMAAQLSTPKVKVFDGDAEVKTFANQQEADDWIKTQTSKADKKGLEAPEYTTKAQPIYDEAFLASIIDPAIKTEASPAKIYKMMLALQDAGKNTLELGRKVTDAKAKGILTDELAVEFRQALALEGVLTKAVKGRQVDVARTLGILGQARTASTQRVELLQEIIKSTGGVDNVHDVAKSYLALSSSADRARIAEKSLSGKWYNIPVSTFINGLVSAPISHLWNIGGNAFFGAAQIPIRATASVVGNVRNMIVKGEDAITMDEVYAQAKGISDAFLDSSIVAWKAFKNNAPTDPATRIEMARSGQDDFALELGESEFGKAASKALKYYGNFITVPGRALLAEDEFFKGIAYRMELNALVTRESIKTYNDAIKFGVSEQDAIAKAQKHYVELMTDVPDSINDAALSQAKTVTFTKELEGLMGDAARLTNNPLLKLYFPFVRTPTNLALQAADLTPGLQFLRKDIRDAYKKGGVDQDIAIAKMTLGGGLIYGASQFTFGHRMTGAGPFAKDDKEALKGTGWQPFSFVFNKSDIDPQILEDYKKLTKVTVGPDKVYVSYIGLQPLATLLSIASTSAEYAMVSDGNDMYDLALGASAGVYDAIGELPMLDSLGELTDIFRGNEKEQSSKLYGFMKRLTKSVTTKATQAIVPYSSAVAAVERYMYPRENEVMSQEMINKSEGNDLVNGATQGYWEGLGYAMARNPVTSSSLPRKLDVITGSVKKVGKGNLYEMFNPFKTSEGKISPAYATLLEYNIPLPIPDKTYKGVVLSDKQYNRIVELATDYGQLEEDVVKSGKQYEDMKYTDLGKAQNLIKKVILDAYSQAKEQLVKEDIELELALENIEESKKIHGNRRR